MMKNFIHITRLNQADIAPLFSEFQKVGWHKPALLFETYLREMETGQRDVWVARLNAQIAGYVTLSWQSHYPPFAAEKIPEIMDLNVLPHYRRQGIGRKLLDIAEQEAASKSKIVGIGVGLYGGPDGGYGAAQKLYVKRGYIPDGKGVTYAYQPAVPGHTYALDDDLVLWFQKKSES